MSAPHTELLHRHDPFLRRRTEFAHRRASPLTRDQPQTYMTASTPAYKADPMAGLQSGSTRDALVQSVREGQELLYSAGKDERYPAQATRGTSDERV